MPSLPGRKSSDTTTTSPAATAAAPKEDKNAAKNAEKAAREAAKKADETAKKEEEARKKAEKQSGKEPGKGKGTDKSADKNAEKAAKEAAKKAEDAAKKAEKQAGKDKGPDKNADKNAEKAAKEAAKKDEEARKKAEKLTQDESKRAAKIAAQVAKKSGKESKGGAVVATPAAEASAQDTSPEEDIDSSTPSSELVAPATPDRKNKVASKRRGSLVDVRLLFIIGFAILGINSSILLRTWEHWGIFSAATLLVVLLSCFYLLLRAQSQTQQRVEGLITRLLDSLQEARSEEEQIAVDIEAMVENKLREVLASGEFYISTPVITSASTPVRKTTPVDEQGTLLTAQEEDAPAEPEIHRNRAAWREMIYGHDPESQ